MRVRVRVRVRIRVRIRVSNLRLGGLRVDRAPTLPMPVRGCGLVTTVSQLTSPRLTLHLTLTLTERLGDERVGLRREGEERFHLLRYGVVE